MRLVNVGYILQFPEISLSLQNPYSRPVQNGYNKCVGKEKGRLRIILITISKYI